LFFFDFSLVRWWRGWAGPHTFFVFICCKLLARWYNSITESAGSVQPRKDRKMTPEQLYTLLDAHGIEYEIVEIFEGVRILSIEVNDDGDDE
jgi:hypothetical protein